MIWEENREIQSYSELNSSSIERIDLKPIHDRIGRERGILEKKVYVGIERVVECKRAVTGDVTVRHRITICYRI